MDAWQLSVLFARVAMRTVAAMEATAGNGLGSVDSAVVELNFAVAVGELDGPEVALRIADVITGLDGYYVYRAVRADRLTRLDRPEEVRAEYDRAIARTTNPIEQRYLARRQRGAVQ